MADEEKSQIRGRTWAKIEAALNALIEEQPLNFRLNMKALERKSGISRTTLYSDDAQKRIEKFLHDQPRAVLSDKRQRGDLMAENSSLKLQVKELKEINRQLLTNYSTLFENMYAGVKPERPFKDEDNRE